MWAFFSPEILQARAVNGLILKNNTLLRHSRRETGVVSPVWNFRAVIWLIFLSPLSFFCLVLSAFFLSCHFSANGPFSWPFSEKFWNIFILFLRIRLFCMALVEQLGDGSWCMRLAAIWHLYLPLCIYIYFIIVSVHSFFNIFFFKCGIDRLDGIVDDSSVCYL